MKDYTHICVVLDASGSMASIEDDTRGSFNSFMKAQREAGGRTVFDLFQFSDKVKRIVERADLSDFREDLMAKYRCSGCTALNDAVCTAIDTLGREFSDMREDERPENVIFAIITDGMENASRAYGYAEVQRMVQHEQEKHGWEFLFLGANMDAIAAARSFGIREDRAVRYKSDSVGTALNYRVVSDAVASVRRCRKIAGDWSAPVEDDVKRRGK